MPKTIGNENTEASGGVSSNILSDTTLGPSIIYSSLQTVGNLQELEVTGGVTIDSTTFHVDEINDRVGIKTTSPQYPLHVEGQTYVNGNVTCTSVTNSGISANESILITGYQDVGDFMKVLLTNNVSYFRLSRLGTGANGDIHLTNNFSRIDTTQSGFGKDDSTLGCQSITLQEDGDIFFSTGSTSDETPISRMMISSTGDVSCYYNLSVSGSITCNGNLTCTSVTNSGISENEAITITGYQDVGDFMKVLLTNNVSYFRLSRLGTGANGDINLTNNFSRIDTTQFGYGKDDSTLGCQSITLQQDGDIFFSTGSSSDVTPISRMMISSTGDVSCYYNLSVSGAITCGSLNGANINGTCSVTGDVNCNSNLSVSGVLTCGSLSLNGATINGTCSVTGDLTTSSSLSINGHKIQNNIKNSVALTNCTTYGVTTSNAYGYYPNFDMTSNSQNGYTVTASSNSTTAYQMFHSNATAWSTSTNYASTDPRTYYGTEYTYTLNANYIYGDHITITFPNPFHLVSFIMRFDSMSSFFYNSSFCASIDNGATWIRLNTPNVFSSAFFSYTFTFTIPTEYQSYTFNAFRLIAQQIVSSTTFANINYFQLYGYPATSSTLTYIPSNVEIGNSLTPNAIPDTDYTLTVNGNVLINGYIKRNYFFGETVSITYLGSSIGNLPIQNNNITSTSYLTIFQFTYEPKISTSIIGIEFDCGYSINGSGSDEWYSRIAIDGITIIEKKQNTNGRTGVLFPIMGNFINSSYSPTATQKTIYIQVRRGSLFNTLTVDNNNSSLKITEIFN